jgi:ribosome-associated protein YbcJ (S4-like RNA binding protein)
MKQVEIEIKKDQEFITLGQFLKFVNIISNGGQAKMFLEDHDIYIDDAIEKRRGRKIYRNMTITFLETRYILR